MALHQRSYHKRRDGQAHTDETLKIALTCLVSFGVRLETQVRLELECHRVELRNMLPTDTIDSVNELLAKWNGYKDTRIVSIEMILFQLKLSFWLPLEEFPFN